MPASEECAQLLEQLGKRIEKDDDLREKLVKKLKVRPSVGVPPSISSPAVADRLHTTAPPALNPTPHLLRRAS
jgi:hypothetical protein